MQSKFFTSGLAIVLGLTGVGTIGFPEEAVAQQQTSEIDTAIAKGRQLLREGNANSYRKSIGYFEKALGLARSSKAKDKQTLSLLYLGVLHNSLGEKQKAIEYYSQSLSISRAVGDRRGEATTLTDLGSVYYHSGEKQKAIEYFNQSLSIRRAVGDRHGEATTLVNLGSAYRDLGENQKAIRYYNQSLPILRAVGNRYTEAFVLNDIGLVLNSQEQPEPAIAAFKESINIYESIRKDNQKLSRALRESYTKSIADKYQALADLLIKQGRPAEAEAVLELLKIK